MTLLELVQAAKLDNEKAFGSVNEKRAQAIIRAAFSELSKHIINAKGDEKITLPNFGTFVAKETEREKDGQKVMRRKIIFRGSPPKTKKADKETSNSKE
jgi:nucleoid DNA-binding protein